MRNFCFIGAGAYAWMPVRVVRLKMGVVRDFRQTAGSRAASNLARLRRLARRLRFRAIFPNLSLPKIGVTPAPWRLRRSKRRLSTRYSLVVACYNVEKYIDDFFRSIFIQTVDPDCLEIITVDDGSTDLTAARIADWAQRFPGSIRYLHQPNQGQAVARNTGLACATGEWVSFPDPDDTLSTSYFEEVDAEIARAHSQPLSMVACNLVFFKEAKRSAKEEDTHPLRYRFEQERTILPASDLQDHMQLSTATAWLRRELIERNELRFDPRVVPTFEDGHFVNRFLLLNAQTEVAFLKRPIYHYRKRGDGSSTLDGAKLTAAWCLDALRYGYLDLLSQAQTIAGDVPRFIQRTVLYDILWRFHYLLDHPERVVLHTQAERKEFMGLLEKIFAGIEQQNDQHVRFGLLHRGTQSRALGSDEGGAPSRHQSLSSAI